MRQGFRLATIGLATFITSASAQVQSPSAILQRAVDAMGGVQSLRGLTSSVLEFTPINQRWRPMGSMMTASSPFLTPPSRP